MNPETAGPLVVELASRLSPLQALAAIVAFPVVLGAYLLLSHRERASEAGGTQGAATLKVLLEGLQAETVRLRALLDQYGVELEQLRAAKAVVAGQMRALMDAAIAARLLVHTLQRQTNLPETEFAPLPGVEERAMPR